MTRKLNLRQKGFTLIEALTAIAIMVITAAAILSTFFYSSNLRVFSEYFTLGINAAQRELESIRYRYITESLSFDDLCDYKPGETYYSSLIVSNLDGTPNNDFVGEVEGKDAPSGSSPKEELVRLTARIGFRQNNRIVGAESDFSEPSENTPCQVSIIIVNRR